MATKNRSSANTNVYLHELSGIKQQSHAILKSYGIGSVAFDGLHITNRGKVIILLKYFKGLDKLPGEVMRRLSTSKGEYISLSYQRDKFEFIYVKPVTHSGVQA